ncbi:MULTISPECIES: DUF2059 domain-containing protein [Pseudomonas]|uniref:hypothetical protein n=1 Tax=Pseudomonas sp. TSRC2-2 TaxID=2804571 RepID=UPI003CF1C75E
MIKASKWAISALCAALLAGCGSSQDKAEELVEKMGLDSQYKMVVQMATAGYATKYREVPPEKIRAVIEDNISQDLLKETLVEIYTDHFDADELELMIKANKNPADAMKIIMGSKDGIKLAQKSVQVQAELQQDMAKAFADRDEDIIDELDDLQKEARG